MDEHDWLAERFEASRTHLRAVAYRMLGSLSEADDAVQEAWLRLSRSDTSEVENLGGWLTTVVARVCLDMLRSRKSRREEPLGRARARADRRAATAGVDPEHEALLADSVGLALLVVLETLAPAERLAFVLHDMFAVPFDEIAPDRGALARPRPGSSRAAPAAGCRARPPTPDADLARQREVVDAFLAASRDGDFDALLAVLDPDVVLRADGGAARPGASVVVRGAAAVAGRAHAFARPRRSSGPRSSTAPPASSWPRTAAVLGHRLHGRAAGGSSRSTRSPTPSACASSTWRSSTTARSRDPGRAITCRSAPA